ncbi:MAG: helix-turn-helix domain-containing protein [Clostridium sp.]|nr:helix-turn-helix domain-containing protein [Clostridium sp.]
MNFSDKLRGLIEERNLTQKQVANDLNIAPSTMGGYVQGSSEPDFEILKRLAKYFNVSADYLLNIQSSNCNSSAEDELLRVFRSMNAEHQQLFIEQGKVFANANNIYKETAKS